MTEPVEAPGAVHGDLNHWWRLGVPLVVAIERALFRVRVTGIHHVPLEGPAILAFDHISVLDGPCLAAEVAWRRRRMVRFLVAAEVFDVPVTGWILRRYRQIPIRRGRNDASALDDAVNPKPGELQRIRSGIARIALPTGAPVIPVGIWGTHRRWSKSGRHWGPQLRPRLGLAFGEPIEPKGDVSRQDEVDAFLELVREALERQLAEARTLADDRRPD